METMPFDHQTLRMSRNADWPYNVDGVHSGSPSAEERERMPAATSTADPADAGLRMYVRNEPPGPTSRSAG